MGKNLLTEIIVILSKLYDKFPNKKLQMHIFTTESPIATIKSNGTIVTAIGDLKMMVETETGLAHAFTLVIKAMCSGSAFLVDNKKIAGNLTYVSMNAAVKESEIGDFDISLLSWLLNLLLQKGLVPLVNGMLKNGFDLPLGDDITLVNPIIQVNLFLSTNGF